LTGCGYHGVVSQQGPLTGLTVVDLTRVLSGPYCTMVLGDMGARVIKVEQPGRGDDTRAWGPPFVAGESAYFLGVNRNKQSVTLDFKHEAGRAVLDQLISRADVLVENFRPGTLDRLGLGFAAVHAIHPRLVYCSISGFGHTGPRRDQPGYDAVIQAEGGLMSMTGAIDGPPYRVGTAIADLVAGLHAAQGIGLALYARERTGTGQFVDISMLDGVVSLLSHHASTYLATGAITRRMGNGHAAISPYDTFAAADGEFFLAVGNDEQFRRFCDVAGLLEMVTDPRFATNPARVAHDADVRARIGPVLRARTRAMWLEALTTAGVPCGSVRNVAEALADPQVTARNMIEVVEHLAAGPLKVLGVPIKLSDTPGSVRAPPPLLGQHTDLVLRELGMNDEAIARLRVEKAI
jgi:crotonobetainyl-CoA:carnitine CoA-transferase CaiB-like acyl-CoA transferase